MRRMTVILMIFSAVLLIITGIAESHSAPARLPGHHLAAASLFLGAALIHAWYNRKVILKYFGDLGWRWAIIAGCLAGVLVAGLLIEL